ncbi:Moesin/ezrin/radixin-like protein 1 [Cercospora zeina]
MQTEFDTDAFLAALRRCLKALSEGRPSDTYLAEIESYNPHCSIVPVTRHIARVKELLTVDEHEAYEAQLHKTFIVCFGGKVQPSQWEFRDTTSRLEQAFHQAEAWKRETNELEQKLKKAEAEHERLFTQASMRELNNNHDDLMQMQSDYSDLLQRHDRSDVIVKQLLQGRQRRDSGVVDQATDMQNAAIPPVTTPQALQNSIESSVALLREQMKDQQERLEKSSQDMTTLQEQLAELEADKEDLRQEKEAFHRAKGELEAQSVTIEDELATAQQKQQTPEEKVRMLDCESNVLWEHLAYLEHAGEENMSEGDEPLAGWVQQATVTVRRAMRWVNERQKMYYVLH